MKEEGEIQRHQIHAPRYTTHKLKDNYNFRGSPQGERGVRAPHQSPFAWFLHHEDKSLGTLKASRTYIQER